MQHDRAGAGRRVFLEQLFAATVVAVAAPGVVLGRILPTLRQVGEGFAGRYRIDLNTPAYAALRTVGGSVMLARITGVRFRVIVTRVSESAFAAVNATCTHLGCTVRPLTPESDGHLVCPCHGSRFQPDGQLVEGPAEEPLERLETYFDGGDFVEIEISGLAAVAEEFSDMRVGSPVVDSDGRGATLGLSLERASDVRVDVHTATGELVGVAFDAELAGGSHRIRFDLENVPEGTYFVRVSSAGRSIISRRFVVAR